MSTYHTFKDPESIERSSSRHGRDVEEANDDIFETMFGISVRQLDVEERMKFVRKIYIIIAAQLATMVLFTYISMYIEVISDWIQWSKWVWWIPLLPITICALGCSYMLWSQHRELSWRARYSLLTVFTVLEGIVVCDLCMCLSGPSSFVDALVHGHSNALALVSYSG
ncbi:hypothetical protein BC938DRAFT_475073 [Jimgerdemannia flammicorona]|uniref:Transmembrane protein n=1 Tax=Jimgerdemannia flammicorona TaxID=994334 RepID=A0A433QS07_9FUNG|nr:hypothetical protein BC938DRAFT_475073 [Jimgerdemannia flammicorona]